MVEDFYSDSTQFQSSQDRSHHLGACHSMLDICIFLNIWMTGCIFFPTFTQTFGVNIRK